MQLEIHAFSKLPIIFILSFDWFEFFTLKIWRNLKALHMNKHCFLLSKQSSIRQTLDVQIHSLQELEGRKVEERLSLAQTSISTTSLISYSQVLLSILFASTHCLNFSRY